MRTVHVSPVHHISVFVEPQNVGAHTRGPSRFDLVLVPEQLLSGHAPSIVQFTVGEHPKHGALASVHIAHHSNPAQHHTLFKAWCSCQRPHCPPQPPCTTSHTVQSMVLLPASTLPTTATLHNITHCSKLSRTHYTCA